MNSFIIKGMSNIYLEVTIEKNWPFQNIDFLRLKKFVSKSVFGELKLTQIPLNFQTSCCNLKITGLGAKLGVAFLLFLIWQELRRFKVKESMHFVEQKYKL